MGGLGVGFGGLGDLGLRKIKGSHRGLNIF